MFDFLNCDWQYATDAFIRIVSPWSRLLTHECSVNSDQQFVPPEIGPVSTRDFLLSVSTDGSVWWRHILNRLLDRKRPESFLGLPLRDHIAGPGEISLSFPNANDWQHPRATFFSRTLLMKYRRRWDTEVAHENGDKSVPCPQLCITWQPCWMAAIAKCPQTDINISGTSQRYKLWCTAIAWQ